LQVFLVTLWEPAKPARNPWPRMLEHHHHILLKDQRHRSWDAERDHQNLHQSHLMAKNIEGHFRDHLLSLWQLSLKTKNHMSTSEILASTSTSIHWTRARILDRILEMLWLHQWPGLVDWLGTHQIRHAKRRSTRTVLGALGENSPILRALAPGRL
jgi:hypothetical protein